MMYIVPFFLSLFLAASAQPTTTKQRLPKMAQLKLVKNNSQYKAVKKHFDIPMATKKIKDWNLIVYMAANNNLHCFSIRNLQQMIHVGSNENINILVQLDGFRQQNVSRYFVEKDRALPIEILEYSNSTISGTTKSLFKFVKWSTDNYPAKHTALLLWNHGSGIKDPSIWGKKMVLHRDELFSFNHNTCMLQLDRSILDDSDLRGIGFNDTFETYITNQELTRTLTDIKEKVLNNKKIDLLIMDACYMSMVEVCTQVKNTAKYMVGSQEIEPGSGYNYIYILEPFQKTSLTPTQFAEHIVKCYKKEYYHFNADFTHSAINLTNFELLENNIESVSTILKRLLCKSDDNNIDEILRKVRFRLRYTTEFCDPDYIDCQHFYKSLLEHISTLKTSHPSYKKLEHILIEGLNIFQKQIIANVSGINLPKAQGLSIYFPKRSVHSSYYKTQFNKKTSWADFLNIFSNRIHSNSPSPHLCNKGSNHTNS